MWKQIFDYEVSSIGEVRYVKTKKLLKQDLTCNGYLRVALYINKKRKWYKVHRLVAEAFIPNPNNFNEINHKDGNKLNNSVENLEWCTRKYNAEHALNNGLYNSQKVQKINELGELIQEYPSIRSCLRQNKIRGLQYHLNSFYNGYFWKII